MRRLSPNLDEWTIEDEREFFFRIGSKLEGRHAAGRSPDFAEVIREIAAELADGAGQEADQLADELIDASYNGVAGGGIWDHHHGRLVSMYWPGGQISATAGLDVLDLGSGNLLIVEPPDDIGYNEHWVVVDVIDRSDTPRMKQVMLDFMAEGPIPDRLSFKDVVTRQDVERAYEANFDSGMFVDWAYIAAYVGDPGAPHPIETVEQRRALLSLWLDAIIR